MKITRSFKSITAIALVAAMAFGSVNAEDEAPVKLKRITKTLTPINGVKVVDLFDAIKNKQIEVNVNAPNFEHANIKVVNKGKKPLSIKILAAFAGVPVAAQGLGHSAPAAAQYVSASARLGKPWHTVLDSARSRPIAARRLRNVPWRRAMGGSPRTRGGSKMT